MNDTKKVFAFKLVEKKEKAQEKTLNAKWTAREGIAVAGCTDVGSGDYRWHQWGGADTGFWC